MRLSKNRHDLLRRLGTIHRRTRQNSTVSGDLWPQRSFKGHRNSTTPIKRYWYRSDIFSSHRSVQGSKYDCWIQILGPSLKFRLSEYWRRMDFWLYVPSPILSTIGVSKTFCYTFKDFFALFNRVADAKIIRYCLCNSVYPYCTVYSISQPWENSWTGKIPEPRRRSLWIHPCPCTGRIWS